MASVSEGTRLTIRCCEDMVMERTGLRVEAVQEILTSPEQGFRLASMKSRYGALVVVFVMLDQKAG